MFQVNIQQINYDKKKFAEYLHLRLNIKWSLLSKCKINSDHIFDDE